MTKNQQSTYLLWGMGLGAVGGLLLAPRTGIKTRKRLVAKAMQGRKFLAQQSSEGRRVLLRSAKRAQEAVNGLADAFDTQKRAFLR